MEKKPEKKKVKLGSVCEHRIAQIKMDKLKAQYKKLSKEEKRLREKVDEIKKKRSEKDLVRGDKEKCPECGKVLNSRSMKRHLSDVHNIDRTITNN